jgi:hypothetical protein
LCGTRGGLRSSRTLERTNSSHSRLPLTCSTYLPTALLLVRRPVHAPKPNSSGPGRWWEDACHRIRDLSPHRLGRGDRSAPACGCVVERATADANPASRARATAVGDATGPRRGARPMAAPASALPSASPLSSGSSDDADEGHERMSVIEDGSRRSRTRTARRPNGSPQSPRPGDGAEDDVPAAGREVAGQALAGLDERVEAGVGSVWRLIAQPPRPSQQQLSKPAGMQRRTGRLRRVDPPQDSGADRATPPWVQYPTPPAVASEPGAMSAPEARTGAPSGDVGTSAWTT